jgi:hypothetical protein
MLTLKTMQHGLLRDEIGENNATKKKKDSKQTTIKKIRTKFNTIIN